jgi:hypothetical protein
MTIQFRSRPIAITLSPLVIALANESVTGDSVHSRCTKRRSNRCAKHTGLGHLELGFESVGALVGGPYQCRDGVPLRCSRREGEGVCGQPREG